ncbi:MAG: hypothetical protein RR349_02785 [Oscillospiraceae bacterium]
MFTRIIRKEKSAEIRLQHFLNSHPVEGLLIFFFGMPLFVFAAVFCCAAIAIFPITWLFGIL